MINIILIIGIINYLIHFIFKPKYEVLNCGIFGQITNDVNKIDNSSIKILGMFNESRGKQSCGVFIDNHIEYGLDKLSLFSDFALFHNFNPTEIPMVIGHTRQSSVGVVNKYNAHPFGFEPTVKGYKYVGMHNGTLSNHKELAAKYDINVTDKTFNEDGTISIRTKIDSELLLETLITTKNYNILSEYIGRAALCWIDTEANITYLWSGESKTSNYMSTLEEERPLNVYLKDDNNFFFSSLMEPLIMIGGDSDNVFQIDYNTLHIIVDGDFKNCTKLKIDRSDSLIKDYVVTNAYPARNYYGWNDFNDFRTPPVTKPTTLPTAAESKITSILGDIKVENSYNVYMEKLRFWEDDKLVNGCYIWIPLYGYYKLSDDTVQFGSLYDALPNFSFSYIEERFIPSSELDSIANTVKVLTPTKAYIIQGCELLSEFDYNIAKSMIESQGPLSYEKLSHITKHPVFNINKTNLNINKQRILKDGKPYNGMYSALGFNKSYCIKNGNFYGCFSVISPTKHKVTTVTTADDYKYPHTTVTACKQFLNKFCKENEKTDFVALAKFKDLFKNTIDESIDSIKELKESSVKLQDVEKLEYDIVIDEISELLSAYKQTV